MTGRLSLAFACFAGDLCETEQDRTGQGMNRCHELLKFVRSCCGCVRFWFLAAVAHGVRSAEKECFDWKMQ